MAQYVWMSRCLEGLPAGTLKIIDCHDVCSTHAEKVEAFGIKEPFMMTVAQEVERLARADVVIAIHAGERDALQRMGLEAEVVTVGVDLEEQPSQRSPIPGRILCVAADNEPNIRGLRDFLHISWPVIRATRLDVRLHVVGGVTRYLPVTEGVSYSGFIPDLAPAYEDAEVVINPSSPGPASRSRRWNVYVETEYFGGVGSQSGVTFVGGEPTVVEIESEVQRVPRSLGAINSGRRTDGCRPCRT